MVVYRKVIGVKERVREVVIRAANFLPDEVIKFLVEDAAMITSLRRLKLAISRESRCLRDNGKRFAMVSERKRTRKYAYYDATILLRKTFVVIFRKVCKRTKGLIEASIRVRIAPWENEPVYN